MSSFHWSQVVDLDNNVYALAFKDDVFVREQYQEPYSRVMIRTKIIADYNLAEFLTTIAFAGV